VLRRSSGDCYDVMGAYCLSHLFSKENQVQIYMHARIKFPAYSDI
jgi:hypothetical protein